MKRLTIISLGVIALGFLLPFIGTYTGLEALSEIGDYLLSIGFLMVYVFLIAWQAEVGRTSLIVTSVLMALFFLSFMIYGFIKADEAEKRAADLYSMSRESDLLRAECFKLLKESQEKVTKLELELAECETGN